MKGRRVHDDWLEEAKEQFAIIGGFRGNGPEERGVVSCAAALISIAEDVRAIRAALPTTPREER